jgi:hypothetical protein
MGKNYNARGEITFKFDFNVSGIYVYESDDAEDEIIEYIKNNIHLILETDDLEIEDVYVRDYGRD